MPYKDPEKQREAQRLWIAQRRREWIEENGPCVQCGSCKDLEIDHIDSSTKLFSVGSLWSLSRENPKRVAELDKCQILCHDCHVAKTWSEDGLHRATDSPHGTVRRYKLPCRCEACRAAKKEENARRYH